MHPSQLNLKYKLELSLMTESCSGERHWQRHTERITTKDRCTSERIPVWISEQPCHTLPFRNWWSLILRVAGLLFLPPWGKALSEFPTWRIKNFPLGGEKKKKKTSGILVQSSCYTQQVWLQWKAKAGLWSANGLMSASATRGWLSTRSIPVWPWLCTVCASSLKGRLLPRALEHFLQNQPW